MGNSETKEYTNIRVALVDDKPSLLNHLTSYCFSDYEKLYLFFEKIPEHLDIDLIIRTHGGPVLWCAKICYLIQNRPGKVRVFALSYAHSAGTIISLAADELYVTKNTTFSAIDTQGSPFSDFFRTSMKMLPELVRNPSETMANVAQERSNYFRSLTENYINTELHDKDRIMEYMHDNVSIHQEIFFPEQMKNIGIKFNYWNGKEIA